MEMTKRLAISALTLALSVLGGTSAIAAQEADTAMQSVDRDPWPRQVATPSGRVTLYQPQVDSWTGNALTFHAAVAIQARDSAPEIFGVLFATARTEVDKPDRLVILQDFAITKVKFPAHAESAASYLTSLHAVVPTTARTISLDRLQASLAVAQNKAQVRKAPVANTPPTIFTSPVPAILVLVDGAPVLRPVPGSTLLRVVNTGVLLLFDGYTYYLHVFDGWLQAVSLKGPWAVSYLPPATIDQALAWAKTQRIQLLTGTSPDPAEPVPSLYTSTIPVIYTSITPAALIVTQGVPDYVSIPGTDLLYVSNTSGHIFEYIDDQRVYVLLGGRWFKAPSLHGPWQFVAPEKLPADFRRIPLDSPMEPVLASIPGTPQAQEAVIENSVPQTAAISRDAAMPAPEMDGAPTFVPIPGTALQYVANASVPIILAERPVLLGLQRGLVRERHASRTVDRRDLGAGGDLYHSAELAALLRHVRAGVRRHRQCGVRRLHPRLLWHGGHTLRRGGLRHRLRVHAMDRRGLLSAADDLRLRRDGRLDAVHGMVRRVWHGYSYGGVAVGVTYGGAMWGVHPYYGPAYYGGAYTANGYVAAGPGGWAGTTGNVYTQYGSKSMVTNTSAGYNAYTGNGWSQKTGSSYNSTTGVAAAGQRSTVSNAYTGNYQSYASGTATNTKTGTTATGYTNTTGNAYTGQQTKTGQAEVTSGATGKTTDVSAVQTNNASAVKVNNNVYGDVNGNVYKSNDNGSWSQYNGSSTPSSASSGGWGNYSGSSSAKGGTSTSSLNSQSASRSAGASRSDSYSSYGGGGGGGRRK